MGAAESKLAFRKSLFRLAEEQRIPHDNEAFWAQFWTVPENAEDVFALVTPADIRRIRDHSRGNFTTLIEKTVDQMLRIMHAPGYPSPVHSVEALLNTIRLLTRLLPFLFEMLPDDTIENNLFWTAPNQNSTPNGRRNSTKEGALASMMLGEQLMISAIDLLFLKELTLPSTEATRQSRVNYLIWEQGIAMKGEVTVSREIQQHRIEVLRLILCLLSKAMYITPDGRKTNRWLNVVSTGTDKKAKMALLCSLLNTVANYGSGRWQLPYQHVMFNDKQQQLATLSIQVLLVLLDQHVTSNHQMALPSPAQSLFSLVGEEDEQNVDEEVATSAEGNDVPLLPRSRQTSIMSESSVATGLSVSTKDNLFQFYLARLHRPQDLQYLSDELYRIISQPIKARNSYLPNSAQPVTFQLETILLLWHLYLNNEKFRQQVLNTHVADLSIAILYTALAHKLDPAQIGLVRLCVCVLQSFSVESKFAKALNKVFVDETNLPAVARIPSFSGTFADYLIISVNTLITSTRNTLASLYEPLLSILCNLSPHFMNVSVVAAHKLVQLFTIFASPAMLLADRHHPRRLILIADTLDRIVQYGFKDNPHVIYSIVRANDKIRLLKDFTLTRVSRNSTTTITTTTTTTQRVTTRQESNSSEEHAQEMEETNLLSPSSSTTTTVSQRATSPSYLQLSEKAMGKLPVGVSPISTPTTPTTPTVIYSGNSGNNNNSGNSNTFVPTEAWVSSWLPKVKLDQLLHMLDIVVPRVEALCSSGHLTSDHEILILLRSNELLKEVHPNEEEDTNNDDEEEDKLEMEKTRLRMRPFQWNDRVAYWCRSLLWGHVYTMYRAPLGLWQGTAIQLFQVKSASATTAATTTTTATNAVQGNQQPSHGSQDNSTSTTSNRTTNNEQTDGSTNTETTH